jgi:hypothetical protein
MRKAFILLTLFVPMFISAQDTIIPEDQKKHEVGFNTVSLIKQIISNNPSATLTQSPYQVIYTLHMPSGCGMRFGFGMTLNNTKTTVEGLSSPRETVTMNFATRIGYNRNFLHYGRLTANFFIDGTHDYSDLKTETVTDFGGGQSLTDKLSLYSQSFGAQTGFGVKFRVNRHIFLYTEVPFQVKMTMGKETDEQIFINPGGFSSTTTTISESTGFSARFFLPTTVYLTVLF